MTQLTENIFAIEVPVDASNFKMAQAHGQDIDLVFDSPSTGIGRGFKPVNGNYSFICASLTATDEQLAEFVSTFDSRPMTRSAFDEILRSKGLNPELNYAILRKQ